jgi:hypothetical protein
MKLETCKRGLHVNRIEMRVDIDRHGNRHTEEWHVCRLCGHDRKHATRKVIPAQDAQWRSSL